jgi:hypothetical protein
MIGNNNDKTENEYENKQNEDTTENNFRGNNFPSNYGYFQNEYYKENMRIQPTYNQNYLKNYQNPNMNYNFQQGIGNYYFNNQNFYGESAYAAKYKRNFDQAQAQYFQKKNYNYQSQEIIQSLKYVSENYPHLIGLNNNSIGLSLKIQQDMNPRFYVIKSFTEEDIHKVKNLLKITVHQIQLLVIYKRGK